MNESKDSFYHKLYGVKNTRIVYRKQDFMDYILMSLITGAIILWVYGVNNIMTLVGLPLCGILVATFVVRHGVAIRMPVLLRRPQDVLYMLIYKIQNIRLILLLAVSLLLIENVAIYFTPEWPHKVELMRTIAFYAFYIHFAVVMVYRTVILVAHVIKREHVRTVLMDSPVKGMLRKHNSILLEIFQGYFTGVLTHIVFLTPWFVVITYAKFSVLFLPVVMVLNFVTQYNFMKVLNDWYYRDHWLGHNSEVEFLYLHGTHHDALPSGLIGVSGNGHLEGVLRNSMGFVASYFHPIAAGIAFTDILHDDIKMHQFIPGVFPKINKEIEKVYQHSTHHYGHLEPYGLAIRVDQPGVSEKIKKLFKIVPKQVRTSADLDTRLNGFEWDTPRYRWYMSAIDKYQDNKNKKAPESVTPDREGLVAETEAD